MYKLSEEKSEKFKIFRYDNNYSFYHISFKASTFYDDLFEYFLSEENLLKFAENNSSLKFIPSKTNYAYLFKTLYMFIDSEHVNIEYDDAENKIVIEEFDGYVDKITGKAIVRLSKIGRLGEYFFHVLLSDYFSFNCVFPKILMSTDKNMSVHGIDVIFYDQKNKMLLFGESKVSKSLDNGIALVNKSLENYEEEIDEEFRLVLSNRILRKNDIDIDLQDGIARCITFKQFINEVGVKQIGIPIFVSHGDDQDENIIIEKLQDKILKNTLFGIDTVYIIISLPIIDKDDFFIKIKENIVKKLEHYATAT
jgi:hypothetical protein